jgi:hypothetical protein
MGLTTRQAFLFFVDSLEDQQVIESIEQLGTVVGASWVCLCDRCVTKDKISLTILKKS